MCFFSLPYLSPSVSCGLAVVLTELTEPSDGTEDCWPLGHTHHCSMSRHMVEGALSGASTIYWNLIALQCEVVGRHMLAQTPSSLANLRCCTNTPLSSTLNSGFPILDTPFGRALHTVWLTWTTATPQNSLPNLNSVFRSTSETRTDKKFSSSVHIQGNIFPLRLSAQPTSFLSEKMEYSKRTFFIPLPPWFQIQALQ